MIDVAIPVEAQHAIGYAAVGGLGLKLLDILIRWRSGQRHDTLSELKEAVTQSRIIRTDLRADLEVTRVELAAAELRAEEAEGREIALKHQLAATDRALASAVAELQTVRFITTEQQKRQDKEDERHTQFGEDERERRKDEETE